MGGEEEKFYYLYGGNDSGKVRKSDSYGTVKKPSSTTVFKKGEIKEGEYVKFCRSREGKDCREINKSTENFIFFQHESVGQGYENEIRSIEIKGDLLVLLCDETPPDVKKCAVFKAGFYDLAHTEFCSLALMETAGNIGKKIWNIIKFWGEDGGEMSVGYKSIVSDVAIFPISK